VFIPKGVIKILIENQLIKLKVNATSLQHYRDLGYAVNVNQIIFVKAEDLTNTCKKEVKVICDYCNKEFGKKNDKLIRGRSILNKDACFDCFPLKQKEVVNKKYAVDCTLQLSEIKAKSQTTLKSNNGVDNIMKSNVGKNEFKQTMLKNYGCEYAQQSLEIQQKTRQSNMNNFGVEHPMYSKDIRQKVANTLFVNGVRVSKNQKKLADNLNGCINTNICGYFADIVFIKDRIILEYNGSGHDLSVQLGKISIDDFNNKEDIKLKSFVDNGWKCIIVENKHEKYINNNHIKEINNIINEINLNINTYKIS